MTKMTLQSVTYPLLAIDSASSKTWVGLKENADTLAFLESSSDPSKSLFELIPRILEKSQANLNDLSSIAFCEGPGSMLGVRTAVMAIRTWRGIGIPAAGNLFVYNSLQMGRALLNACGAEAADGLIATDARRNAWNVLPCATDPSRQASVQIVPTDELEQTSRPLFTLSGFTRWTQTRAQMKTIEYRPEQLFAATDFLSFIRPTGQAQPLSLRASDYKKWTPRIHGEAAS